MSSRRPDTDAERASKSRRIDDSRDAPTQRYGQNSSAGASVSAAEREAIRLQRVREGEAERRSREQATAPQRGSGGDRWNPNAGNNYSSTRPTYSHPHSSNYRDRLHANTASSSARAGVGADSTGPKLSPAAQALAAAAAAERARAEEEAYKARVEAQLGEIEEEKTEEQLAEERRKRREAILNKHNVKPEPSPLSLALAAGISPSDAAAAEAAAASTEATMAAASSTAVPAASTSTTTSAVAKDVSPSSVAVTASDTATAGANASGAVSAAPTPAAPTTAADDYDMFSDSPSGLPGATDNTAGGPANSGAAGEMLDSYDDHDGYYRYRLGDLLEGGRYRVCGLQGSGVFSTVLRVRELIAGMNGAPSTEGRELVVKLIRSNDTMFKAGQKEVEFLKILAAGDPENRKHCVKLLNNFMHRGHLCLVFEPMNMDLRKVIKKFGSVGLSIQAVRSYAKQMCIALKHLRKSNILHGDIKPDNILVNETLNVVKICDFGSATRLDEVVQSSTPLLTPYLVSRFYRAPEIMLGLKYDQQVDLWSIGTCLYELYTGKILFNGSNNNSMLKCIQEVKGRFPKRMLVRAAFATNHFDAEGVFEYHKRDATTQQERVTKVRYADKPQRDLYAMLKDHTGSRASHAENNKIKQLADFIHQCTALDPQQRAKCDELINHPFITTDE